MGIFQDVLLVSDIDGTLVDQNGTLPERNRRAIDQFMRLGGRFALATGRPLPTVRDVAQQVKPNAPCILCNGAVLYDMAQQKAVFSQPVPKAADPLIERIAKRFPSAGLLLCKLTEVCYPYATKWSHWYCGRFGIEGKHTPFGALPAERYKILFMEEPEVLAHIREEFEALPHEEMRAFYSEKRLLEVVADGVDKGNGLAELQRLLGIPPIKTAAIGDYENDVGMLKNAGHSAAPANAKEEIKACAGRTVCDCGQGAVADFIAYLETTLGKEDAR